MSLSNFVAIGIIGFAFLANVESSFGAQVKPVQGMKGTSPIGQSCTATTAQGTTIKGTIVDEGSTGLWCNSNDGKGKEVDVQCGKDLKRCTISKTAMPPVNKDNAPKSKDIRQRQMMETAK